MTPGLQGKQLYYCTAEATLGIKKLQMKLIRLVNAKSVCVFAGHTCHLLNLSYEPCHEKTTFWFQTRSDTNQAVQLKKMARGLKFRI